MVLVQLQLQLQLHHCSISISISISISLSLSISISISISISVSISISTVYYPESTSNIKRGTNLTGYGASTFGPSTCMRPPRPMANLVDRPL